MLNKIRRSLALVALVLSVMGVVTFSLFILEESFQTVMFGVWPAKDAKRWDLVKKGTDHMERVILTLKIVNYTAGWIQPFAFVSYHSYAESARFYLETTRAECFANAPELFAGESVDFIFRPSEVKTMPDGRYMAINGPIGVLTCTVPDLKQARQVFGVLQKQGDLFVVDNK